MKQLNKILFALLFVLAFEAKAQNEQNPWAISFGANAVDTRTFASAGNNFFDARLSQLFLVKQNWNILPSVSYLGLAKSITKNFSVGVQGSINKIDKFVVFDPRDARANLQGMFTVNPGDLQYFGLDAHVKYSLMSLIKSKTIEPSARLGGGYTWIGDNSSASINLGFGLTYWFSEFVGLELQSTYKSHALLNADRTLPNDLKKPDMPNHFQHTLGLVFQFGGKDTDGDGVYDRDDACPQVAGLKQFKGCPDTDGDGIIDGSDDCPTEFGLTALNGCADKDGDGIADKDDSCPDVAGLSSMKGCPDSDGDGITDKDDKCPKVGGTVANGGCPVIDTDKDGIPDSQDDCPTVAGISGNKGCPEVVASEASQSLSAAGKLVFFNSGEATFKLNDDETIKNLDVIFAILKVYPNTQFVIEGHTDSDGEDEANQLLSEARANAVMNAMIAKGINPDNLNAVGFGESKPIASNNTKLGKAKNRRTEVKP